MGSTARTRYQCVVYVYDVWTGVVGRGVGKGEHAGLRGHRSAKNGGREGARH